MKISLISRPEAFRDSETLTLCGCHPLDHLVISGHTEMLSGPTKLPLGHFRSYKVAWGKYMRWPGWFTLGLNYRLGGITMHHQNQTRAPLFKVFILVWVCLYQICEGQLSKKRLSQLTEAILIILNVATTLYILLKLHLNCPSLKSYKNQEIDQEPVSIILYKNVAKTYEEL